MKDKIKIAVLTSNYPMIRFPERGAFVENLVKDWLSNDVDVSVVAPISVPIFFRSLNQPKTKNNIAGNQTSRPFYFSFSNKKIGLIDMGILSDKSLYKAFMDGICKLSIPDFFYGKFLMSGGHAACKAGKKYKKPAYADLGESTLIEGLKLNRKRWNKAKSIIQSLDGVVCASQRLKQEAIELGAKPDNILLAPNTVDLSKFYVRDRDKCRKQLDLPTDDFIVVFVGHFIERKGPFRVLNAINSLDLPIKGVFLGRGKRIPSGNKVLYAGSVPNDEIPVWLNAADLFVLPTLAEGYCNAINEAMACGLPIISSNIPDIQQQVNKNRGVLINPYDEQEIADSIKSLFYDEQRRNQLRNSSKNLFSETRSERILNWLVDRHFS